MILDNYETIVRNIVQGIRDGTIISNNSDKINSLSVKELFQLFTNEFNLNFHKDRIISGLTLSDDILGIPIPIDCIFINDIYFNDIGRVNLSENILLNKSLDNIVYFDLTNVQVPRSQITRYIAITLSYVSFTKEML